MNPTNERIAALRTAMLSEGLGAYLVPCGDPHSSEYLPDHYRSLTWFSGFHGENCNLVVTPTESALWADGRFFVQAEKELAGTEIRLQKMGEPGVPTVEEYCAAALSEEQCLGFCGLTASLGLVQKLKKALEPKKAQIRTAFLEDAIWTENRPPLPATPAWLLSPEFAGKTFGEKLDLLREKLKAEKCTAEICCRLDNIAWLFNLRAMDIPCTPYAMAYSYITENRAVLFLNTDRLAPEAARELTEGGVELRPYDAVLDFLHSETSEQTVLVPETVNYAVYEAVCSNPCLTSAEKTDPIDLLKSVKNEIELDHIRESHIRDAAAMVRFQMELEKRLDAGEDIYETDIDDILHKYRSADSRFIVESFHTISAYGANAAMMHYHPSKEEPVRIERKGFLLVDSGATYMDGTTDITRTYPVGPLTEDEKLFYTWTLQCHIDIARSVWLDYCTGKMIDSIAREPLWCHLINYRCGTGHGVSFVGNVHEGPQRLNGTCDVKFVPGMMITDEPGVYEGGQVGIRIENELECYKKAQNQYGTFLAFRPVMYVPISVSPIVPGVLSREQIEWLNDYHNTVYTRLSPLLNEEERTWLAERCAPIGC